MENKKLYSLDLMKVIAVLMITNSHFVPLYKDVNVAFATFGVQGNALFFFVSGFLLMKGWDKQQAVPFPDWCRNKYRRIFPSALVWSVLTAMAIGSGLSVGKLLCADGYWFLQAILVYYVLEYLILRLTSGFGGGKSAGLWYGATVAVTVIIFFLMPKSKGSAFHSEFHFVCHFSVMLLGSLVYLRRDRIKTRHWAVDTLLLTVSFIAYFAIMSLGKGRQDGWYYTQIVAIVPLHAFVYYTYKVCSRTFAERLFAMPLGGRLLKIVACLTLEIYVVQFAVITDRFNALFPLNTVIVFALILLAAYLLKVCTSLFLWVMGKEPFSKDNIVKI